MGPSPSFLRTLRGRLLLLFAFVAVGPLLTVGVVDYARSRSLVEALVGAQTDTLARRTAAFAGDRLAIVESDAQLFGENAEIQRLFHLRGSSESTSVRRAAESYADELWRDASRTYYSIEVRDTSGTTLLRRATEQANDPRMDRNAISRPVIDVESGKRIGSVSLVPRVNALVPTTAMPPAFGRTGFNAIIDLANDRVLIPAAQWSHAHDVFGPAWPLDSARLRSPRGTIVYGSRDSTRLASFINLPFGGWMVISSTSMGEFADTFAAARKFDLALLLVLAGIAAFAFIVLVTRATRSLEQLTLAAAAVGRGDLSPSLPAASHDEVGVLATTFEDMTGRIRTMLREIEVSRQLVVLGEFAAQLSHEVRNPLTSLKLDLQGMQRQVRSGALPPSASPPIETCLREVNRLDSVVGRILELARETPLERTARSMHVLINDAVGVLAAQCAASNVVIERREAAAVDCVLVDADVVVSTIINLLLNAMEAQPDDGRILIATANRHDADLEWIDVVIADDGPGIPETIRADLFRPFRTSKPRGTGLGLSLALRTARAHGGHLVELAGQGPRDYRGAAFRLSLPVHE